MTESPARRETQVRRRSGRQLLALMAGAAAACLSGGIWALWVYRHQEQLWSMLDLHTFDWGGQTVRTDPAALYVGGSVFLYPPFAALVLAGLSTMSFETLKLVEAASVTGSVFAVIWLTLGLATRGNAEPMPCPSRLAATLALGAAAIWLEPVQQTLYYGQVSALLMLLVVTDLALADRHWYKGVLIGLATGVKLIPGLFVVYLLLTRRFRAAGVASASFLCTVAAGFAVLPEQSRQFWAPAGLTSLSGRAPLAYVVNQSLNGYLVRTSASPEAAHGPWLVAAAAVTLAGLAVAVALQRGVGELGGMLATALVSLLVSPISWTHHWVWVVPGLVWGSHAVGTAHRRWAGLPLAIYALFFAYPMRIALTGAWDDRLALLPKGLVWTMPRMDYREKTWDLGQQVVGNLYSLVGLVVLVLALVWALRRRARRPPPKTLFVHHQVSIASARVTGGANRRRPRTQPSRRPTPGLLVLD